MLVGQARARMSEDLGADQVFCDMGHVNCQPSVLSAMTWAKYTFLMETLRVLIKSDVKHKGECPACRRPWESGRCDGIHMP